MQEEYLTTEEQQVLDELEKNQNRLYKQGKIIVSVIAISNIIGAVVSAFVNFNLLLLIVQIILTIALICGVSWVRYLFAVSAGLNSFLSLSLLFGYLDFQAVNPAVVTYIVLLLVYSIASCVVLFASKAVSEFLYTQKNG